jgi:hypothetical protein
MVGYSEKNFAWEEIWWLMGNLKKMNVGGGGWGRWDENSLNIFGTIFFSILKFSSIYFVASNFSCLICFINLDGIIVVGGGGMIVRCRAAFGQRILANLMA